MEDYERFKKSTIEAIDDSIKWGKDLDRLTYLIKDRLKNPSDVVQALSKDEDFIRQLSERNIFIGDDK